MKPYLDTNFLLRLYLDYPESDAALARLRALPRGTGLCPLTWLHRVEFTNALQLVVFQSRSGAAPRLTPEAAAVALHDFEADARPGAVFSAGGVPVDELSQLARQLAARHTGRIGCRTYDILHVASVLLLKCDAFWSFDTKACTLARAEGLGTL